MLELAGIRDVLAKSIGTTTPINMTRATVEGLQRLVRPEDVAQLRGKTIAEVIPIPRPETLAREEEALAKERAETEAKGDLVSRSSQTEDSTPAEAVTDEESAE